MTKEQRKILEKAHVSLADVFVAVEGVRQALRRSDEANIALEQVTADIEKAISALTDLLS
jgi:flagellar hook-basal body complex protein FliE